MNDRLGGLRFKSLGKWELRISNTAFFPCIKLRSSFLLTAVHSFILCECFRLIKLVDVSKCWSIFAKNAFQSRRSWKQLPKCADHKIEWSGTSQLVNGWECERESSWFLFLLLNWFHERGIYHILFYFTCIMQCFYARFLFFFSIFSFKNGRFSVIRLTKCPWVLQFCSQIVYVCSVISS